MKQISDGEAVLPPIPDSLRAAYGSLIADADTVVAELSSRLQRFIRCGPGCSSCCKSFSVFSLEAALIAEKTGGTDRPATAEGCCPLLADRHCKIYPQRPLICRTQGMPIAYIDEINEQIDVSACPLNFSDEHHFTYDDLYFIDPFNSRLAALNTSYCEQVGLDPHYRQPLG